MATPTPSSLPPGRADPVDEERNRALARTLTRVALVLPLLGLAVSVTAILLSWSSLPEDVATMGGRVGGSNLVPKTVWPIVAVGGSLFTLFPVGIMGTNDATASQDTAERRALRGLAMIAISTLLTVGLTTMNVVMALYGGMRDADGDGALPPLAALAIPGLAIGATALVSYLVARRVRMTGRLRPPVGPKRALAATEAPGVEAWTETLWVSPRLQRFIALVLVLLVGLPVAALLAGAPLTVLLLAVPVPLLLPATGLKWTTRIAPGGITVSPAVGPTSFHVLREEIERVETGRSLVHANSVIPGPIEMDVTGVSKVNMRRGPLLRVTRTDGTSVEISTRDGAEALAAAARILRLDADGRPE